MKRVSIALAALLGIATAAPLAAQDWNGWYAGIGAGQNSYTQDFIYGEKTFIVNGFAQPWPEDVGRSTGAYLLGGYLWQKDRLVYGAEADIGGSKSSIDEPPPYVSGNPFTMCGTPPCLKVGTMGSFTTKGHVRGVFGYSVSPRLLGFATLGVAVADADIKGTWVRGNVDNLFGGAAVRRDNQATIFGPSIGIGAQYKLNPKLTLRGEIVYDKYRQNLKPIGGAGFGGLANDGTEVEIYNSTGNPIDGHVAEFDSTTIRIAAVWEF